MKYMVIIKGDRTEGYKDRYLILNDVDNSLSMALVESIRMAIECEINRQVVIEKEEKHNI
jgi:hypothetical protein